MRSLFTTAAATALALVLLPTIPQRAQASTGVMRCQMPDGTTAYTNQACSSLGGKSVPLPAEVLVRIARDQRMEARLHEDSGEVQDDGLLAGISDGAVVPARRPVARGCATSPQQLALDLQASVALGDVNRIAESFDWAGMQSKPAQRVMARLEQLAQRPVQDAEFFDAGLAGSALVADAGYGSSPNGNVGVLQVTVDAGDGASIIDFEVHSDKGCYLLHY